VAFLIVMAELKPVGTTKERELFTEVIRHYEVAKEDLEKRIIDFDKADVLFRSHIEESGWPYGSTIFDPRIFTAIFEKSARLFAKKPRGRMVPREGGDTIGAQINNELLSFQWDDNERSGAEPMLAKWATMDMNARKYGASFAIAKWKYETRVKRDKKDDQKGKKQVFFDGPDFTPIVNRDCLPNPSYSTIKNWFQYRDYTTVQELKEVNDAARSKPVYKNLDILRQKVKEDKGGGDTRESNYLSKNKSISNLTDYLGRDEVFKTFEIITEYRNDRWITFAPKHGVIIRDIPNPYDHGQIPVILLKYYPIDDDLYGLSEIEPVAKLQRATNALWSQYVDAINMSLYAPLKVRTTGVQMHTLEFGPGKKWLMNDPSSDVMTHDQSPTGVTEFSTTYRLLVSAMQEGLGETSAITSGALPGASDKTATEVKDTATQRLARDNFNQIFLSESMKKQMMFWHKMNQQFLFKDEDEHVKVIRIVGKDAIRYFEKAGLGGKTIDDQLLADFSSEELDGLNLNPEEFATDRFPVEVEGEILPKFAVDELGEMGHLLVEKEDLSGSYDYIPDVQSMSIPDEAQMLGIKRQLVEIVQNPVVQGSLAQEGYRINMKELMEDFFESAGLKDADKYFERSEQNGANQGGGAGIGGVQPGVGGGAEQGMAGSVQANVGAQGPQQLGGPQGVQQQR